MKLANFAPQIVFEATAKCIELISPEINIPKTLPSGMAQRFSATASLAEACVVCII